MKSLLAATLIVAIFGFSQVTEACVVSMWPDSRIVLDEYGLTWHLPKNAKKPFQCTLYCMNLQSGIAINRVDRRWKRRAAKLHVAHRVFWQRGEERLHGPRRPHQPRVPLRPHGHVRRLRGQRPLLSTYFTVFFYPSLSYDLHTFEIWAGYSRIYFATTPSTASTRRPTPSRSPTTESTSTMATRTLSFVPSDFLNGARQKSTEINSVRRNLSWHPRRPRRFLCVSIWWV